MIVADTGGLVALIDRDDRHHDTLRGAFEAQPADRLLPWAILPEVDHIVAARLGREAARAFHSGLAHGPYTIEWIGSVELAGAPELWPRDFEGV